ncbi:MAG: hypothetical protein ACP5P3_05910 [Ignavibacteria bacterium]
MYHIFGKYNDFVKSNEQLQALKEAEKQFKKLQYLKAYKNLIEYLMNPRRDNIKILEDSDRLIKFELIQGSKRCIVTLTPTDILAESIVAVIKQSNVSLLRKLLEQNYYLMYSKTLLRDNEIIVRFDSNTIDCPPEKLYLGLIELSVKADSMDDIILDQFAGYLIPVDEEIKIPLPDDIKKIKYEYFVKWIQETLNKISSFDESMDPLITSYLLLTLTYRIDYLLHPEGVLSSELDKVNYTYFLDETKTIDEKIDYVTDLYRKLLSKNETEISKHFYYLNNSFSLLQPVSHQVIQEVIAENQRHIKWLEDNALEEYKTLIYEYISGYCLFNFKLPKPIVKLLHIGFIVLYPEYFNALGIGEKLYSKENNNFNVSLIKEKISGIIAESKELYQELEFNTDELNFETLERFFQTFYELISKMNLKQKDANSGNN